MPSAQEAWKIGGSSANAIGRQYKGSFCAKRYRSKQLKTFDGRWYGGRATKRGRNWTFRTYWYYTVQWRVKARSLRGKKARRASKKAKRFYSLYKMTSSPGHNDIKSPKNCYKLDSLRFSLKGAVALAVQDTRQASTNAAGISSNSQNLQYLAVGANGDIRDALTTLSGEPGYMEQDAVPSRIWTAPNGKLYAFWEDSSAWLSVPAGEPVRCQFAEIGLNSDAAKCIEKNARIDFGREYGPYEPGAEPVQFDALGRVYYVARVGAAGHALSLRRLDSDGRKTDLINEFQGIGKWRVLNNGTVVIAGWSSGDDGAQRYWLRRIRADNNNQDLFSTNPGPDAPAWMQVYPDGNVYFPFGEIQRFEPDLDRVTPLSSENYWTQVPPAIRSDHLKFSFRRSIGVQTRQFGVFGDRWGSTKSLQVAQIYPEYDVYPVSLGQVNLVAPVDGPSALISGAKSPNGNDFETILLNLESGVETPIIEYSPSSKLDVYHLISRGSDTVLFDALRFSDNKYVLGEIDLQTGDYRFIDSPGGRLLDLMALETQE